MLPPPFPSLFDAEVPPPAAVWERLSLSLATARKASSAKSVEAFKALTKHSVKPGVSNRAKILQAFVTMGWQYAAYANGNTNKKIVQEAKAKSSSEAASTNNAATYWNIAIAASLFVTIFLSEKLFQPSPQLQIVHDQTLQKNQNKPTSTNLARNDGGQKSMTTPLANDDFDISYDDEQEVELAEKIWYTTPHSRREPLVANKAQPIDSFVTIDQLSATPDGNYLVALAGEGPSFLVSKKLAGLVNAAPQGMEAITHQKTILRLQSQWSSWLVLVQDQINEKSSVDFSDALELAAFLAQQEQAPKQ
jgi:hypothetical protein